MRGRIIHCMSRSIAAMASCAGVLALIFSSNLYSGALMAPAQAQQPPDSVSQLPARSSCGKPTALTKKTDACDVLKCSVAEGEFSCAKDGEKAGEANFIALVNAELEKHFKFNPSERDPDQKKHYQNLKALLEEANRAEGLRASLVDKLKTARDGLAALDVAVSKGSSTPSEQSYGDLKAAYDAVSTSKDVDPEVAGMLALANDYSTSLSRLRTLLKSYRDAGGTGDELYSDFTRDDIVSAHVIWKNLVQQLGVAESNASSEKGACKPCTPDQSQSRTPANSAIKIIKAEYGDLPSGAKCDGTRYVDIQCSRVPIAYDLCQTSATDPQIRFCEGKPTDIKKKTHVAYVPPPSNLKLDVCEINVSANGICGGASQKLKRTKRPRKARIEYTCTNGKPGGTLERRHGEVISIDCH